MFDVNRIRKDFPILEEEIYGKPLVYLDNGATTQRPLQVVERMTEYYLRYNSNVHRGVHYLSNKCTDANEQARETVREFINAVSTDEIIFTRGTTESINLVAHSFGESFIREGDEIIVTEMEHHANIVPWQMLCERKKAVLKVVPFNGKGELNMEEFGKLLNERVKLVGVAYVSNVLGTVNPVKEIIDAAHAFGAYVLVDGAQRYNIFRLTCRLWIAISSLFPVIRYMARQELACCTGSEACWSRCRLGREGAR